jgi:hypothetical protein
LQRVQLNQPIEFRGFQREFSNTHREYGEVQKNSTGNGLSTDRGVDDQPALGQIFNGLCGCVKADPHVIVGIP